MTAGEHAVLESTVEKYLVREAAKLGGESKKITDLRGWPDRVIVYDFAVLHWIECKRPKGGKFEPLQERVHARLRKKGQQVFVLLNKSQVDEYIRATRLQLDRARIEHLRHL